MPNKELEKPLYPFPPFGTRASLAKMLAITVAQLDELERDANHLYHVVEKRKKSGESRVCYDAKPALKDVHGRIKVLILRRVTYPSYLTGGLPHRDYLENANRHLSPRVMVSDDIEDFFPSICSAIVYNIWRYFFHFHADVAHTLTLLTTRRGELPQGARTSSYLANLVFWAIEPQLVQKLQEMGFSYSRYVDDITISSKTDQPADQIGIASAMVGRMVRRYGLQLKSSKHKLVHAGARMEVTGLVVNGKAAGVTKPKHSAVRALVFRYERKLAETPQEAVALLRNRVRNVLGQYGRFHSEKANALKLRVTSAEERALICKREAA
jgi:hypothetical protein